MKIALITTDKFTDYELLKLKLDELYVTEVICGNSVAYELSLQYQKEHNNITVVMAEGKMAHSAYNAMKEAETVLIFTNGNGNTNKPARTDLAIAKALETNKTLFVCPYKASAFDITTQKEYIKLDFKLNMKKSSNIGGIYLNKDQAKKLIASLEELI